MVGKTCSAGRNHSQILIDNSVNETSQVLYVKIWHDPVFYLNILDAKITRTHPRTSLFLTQALLSHNWVTRNLIILGPQMTDSRSRGLMVKGTNEKNI